MDILYIHGWGSFFDPNSTKVKSLEKIGNVIGISLDYTKGMYDVLERCYDILFNNDIDLIVGTSLGGYTASHLSSRTGIPFVAINPAINPKETLQKYLGSGVDYAGREYNLTPDIIENLPTFNMKGCGLILLDRDDEVLDSMATKEFIGDVFPVIMFEGGNHRFTHMENSLDAILAFATNSAEAYGLDFD